MNQIMHCVQVETWPASMWVDVIKWLKQNFKHGPDAWYIGGDYNLEDIVMNDEIYIMFILKWSVCVTN
jgi:hypothetical protein